MVRVSKCLEFYERIPKDSGLVKDKKAPEIFLKKIFEFKRKRKYHRWIPVNSLVLTGKTRRSFEVLVEALEEFRCGLGISAVAFYRVVSEFILVPSDRKYYPLRMIFSSEGNQASEEFLTRISDIMPWITDLIFQDFNDDRLVREILEFSSQISSRKINTRNVFHKSKDWFCVYAIKRMASKKGWSEKELLGRIAKFYKRRIKKVTPEMVLSDLVHGELDKLDLQDPKLKKFLEKETKKIWKIRARRTT
jgi:hypothetical protein